MPSATAKDEFVWVSHDRSHHYEVLLQQSKEKIVSLSFEEDVHPLGPNNNTHSRVTSVIKSSVKHAKRKDMATTNVTTGKTIEVEKQSTFIDPLSAMSAAAATEDDDSIDANRIEDDDDLGDLSKLTLSHNK